MISIDSEKKSPAWLNKKSKNQLFYHKNSLTKFDNKRKDKSYSPQSNKPIEYSLSKNS